MGVNSFAKHMEEYSPNVENLKCVYFRFFIFVKKPWNPVGSDQSDHGKRKPC
jgi:hypothetical protein